MGDSRLQPLVLSEDERRTLGSWVKRRSTAQGLALRARIVLACAQGGSNLAVAARLGVNRSTVSKWRARFLAGRLDGLPDSLRLSVGNELFLGGQLRGGGVARGARPGVDAAAV
jgi:hypothetical protein